MKRCTLSEQENELQQLYRLEAGRPVVLSDFNELLKERYVAKVKPIIYLNYANEDQMGWVLYPKDFDPKKTYPGILDIHGGPKRFTAKCSTMKCSYGHPKDILFSSVTHLVQMVRAMLMPICGENMEQTILRI